MIAAAFPPTGGPGVQRSAKFAKYLPEFGWLPTVWTMERMDGLPIDPTLLDDLPDSVTIRRWSEGGAVRSIQRRLRSRGRNGGVVSRLALAADWRLSGLSARMILPDDWAPWARNSASPLRRMVTRDRFDVVYSTFSPASNHLLGLKLKRATGIPWVADFRDLWTDDFRYCEESPRRRRAHGRLQRQILEEADVVIGVTARQTEILAGYVPHHRSKFETITNGFDTPDFAGNGSAATSPRDDTCKGRFVIAHVGRLDGWRTNSAWFEGLRRFASTLGSAGGECALRIVGYANGTARKAFCESGLKCSFADYTSHLDAIAEMRSADALLLIVPDGRNADSVIPAKLFEYLAAGRPILVVGPRGSEPADIVRSCDAGITVSFDAIEISAALKRLYSRWRARNPVSGCSLDRIHGFTRRNLTRRLAEVFDELAAPASLSTDTAI